MKKNVFIALLLGILIGMSIPVAQAGKIVGETSTYAREQGFEQHFFYVASGNGEGQIEFICRVPPGMTGSRDVTSSLWQVQRFTYDSSNRISIINFAGDNDEFDQQCSDRENLDYS